MSLDDPAVVRAQYATETGLETRRSVYENAEGDDAREVAFQAIAASRPRKVLEVGPGPGRAERAYHGRARRRGGRARRVEADGRARAGARRRRSHWRCSGAPIRGCVVRHASWPPGCSTTFPISIGLSEIARVLAPGGQLIAVTNSELHLDERAHPCGVTMSVGFLHPRERRGDPRAGTSRPSSGRTSTAGSRSPTPRRSDATSGR